MIPNCMAFYWEGGPMSWLRLQTLDTFTRLHPAWELVRIPALTEKRFAGLPLDTRSDIARWRWLAENGGWFMDTDLVWLGPLPEIDDDAEAVMTIDSGTRGPEGRAFAMGVVGAALPQWSDLGEGFAAAVCKHATAATASDHQSAGTKAICRAWQEEPTNYITNLPGRLLYPFGHAQRDLDKAWDPEVELPEGLIGLHWSGGHASSRAAEASVTPEWMRGHRAPVAQALRRAYA